MDILEPDVTEEARAITSFMPTDDTPLENAMRLEIGARVDVIHRHASGWTWCETPSGDDAGWVPDSALEPIQSTDLTMDQQESSGLLFWREGLSSGLQGFLTVLVQFCVSH